MGQQPNILLNAADLPRSTPHPGAPRRWSPTRPGELGGPETVPWGGMFGTPGPDTGYAMTILERRDLPDRAGEPHHDVAAALAGIMAARSSSIGRAPVPDDADVAEALLGYRQEGLPASLGEAMATERRIAIGGIAHAPSKLQALVARIPRALLTGSLADVAAAMATGESPLG